MEAGTNTFGDRTFTTDDDPPANNSTASTDALVAQIAPPGGGLDWRLPGRARRATGACPLEGAGFYAAKHNPFVFFQDVAGDPPSQRRRGLRRSPSRSGGARAGSRSGDVASYNFISPNVCHDMHGATGCPDRTAPRRRRLAGGQPAPTDRLRERERRRHLHRLGRGRSRQDDAVPGDRTARSSRATPARSLHAQLAAQDRRGDLSDCPSWRRWPPPTTSGISSCRARLGKRAPPRPRRRPRSPAYGDGDDRDEDEDGRLRRVSGNWLQVPGSRKLLPWDGIRESRGAASSSWARRRAPVKPRPTT